MVVDSSALMAILGREPEERGFRNAIKIASNPLLSAATRVEVGLVALSRKGEPGLDQMQALLESLKLDVVRSRTIRRNSPLRPSAGSATGGIRRPSTSATASPTRSPRRQASRFCSKATTSPGPTSRAPRPATDSKHRPPLRSGRQVPRPRPRHADPWSQLVELRLGSDSSQASSFDAEPRPMGRSLEKLEWLQ